MRRFQMQINLSQISAGKKRRGGVVTIGSTGAAVYGVVVGGMGGGVLSPGRGESARAGLVRAVRPVSGEYPPRALILSSRDKLSRLPAAASPGSRAALGLDGAEGVLGLGLGSETGRRGGACKSESLTAPIRACMCAIQSRGCCESIGFDCDTGTLGAAV
jgi:hypothetical protein